jgi:hypothetical protein
MGASSPWGSIQATYPIMRGAAWVSTAGHGGLRVSRGFADKHFSPQALAAPFVFVTKDYVFFEEDCAWAIAVYESPEIFEAELARRQKNDSQITSEKLLADVLRYVREYCEEYARSMGLLPEKEKASL